LNALKKPLSITDTFYFWINSLSNMLITFAPLLVSHLILLFSPCFVLNAKMQNSNATRYCYFLVKFT
jgi:hypothetical protein